MRCMWDGFTSLFSPFFLHKEEDRVFVNIISLAYSAALGS